MEIGEEDAKGLVDGIEPPGWREVWRGIVGSGRWSEDWLVVIEDVDRERWGLEYELPATEYQECELFYPVDGKVELVKVKEVVTYLPDRG